MAEEQHMIAYTYQQKMTKPNCSIFYVVEI